MYQMSVVYLMKMNPLEKKIVCRVLIDFVCTLLILHVIKIKGTVPFFCSLLLFIINHILIEIDILF